MSFVLLLALLQIDGGASVAPPQPKAAPKAEDREVVQNLELLELLDETSDFELFQELSIER